MAVRGVYFNVVMNFEEDYNTQKHIQHKKYLSLAIQCKYNSIFVKNSTPESVAFKETIKRT